MARQAIMTEHVFYHEHLFGVNVERFWNIADVNVRTVTAIVYALLAVVFVFTYDSNAVHANETFAWIYFDAAFFIQPLTGFLIPRFWAFALPFVAFVASLPISQPIDHSELSPITDAGVMLAGGVIAMILMSFGMACRLTIEAFRNPPDPARSTRA
jgi:hypothetical protein